METNKTYTIEDFARGPIETPLCVDGDAYTIASHRIVGQSAKEKSVYNIALRRSPKDTPEYQGIAQDDRMSSFGVIDYLRDNLTKRLTMEQLESSKRFMKTAHAFGGELDFDPEMWKSVIHDYDGYLPIRVEAVPDGTTIYPNEPMVQVTSLEKGYGEIAALVEANMLGTIANASSKATLTRHMLERIVEYVEDDNPGNSYEQNIGVAEWLIHDFGMRAYAHPNAALIGGKAHLLSFKGTDTFNAAYQAWFLNEEKPVGGSLLAQAHRIVMGHEEELQGFYALRDAAAIGGIGSFLTDTYNTKEALEMITEIAKDSHNNGGPIVVGRPDSGHYLENTDNIIRNTLRENLYTVGAKDRIRPTTLRNIAGDSMDWRKTQKLLNHYLENGFAPTASTVVGIGGWLVNTPSRDAPSAAMKLSASGKGLDPKVKLAEILIKMSVPGPVQLLRGTNEASVRLTREETPQGAYNILETFYNGAEKGAEKFSERCIEPFGITRERNIYEFAQASKERKVLSDKIVKLQLETLTKHGKTLESYTE
ncbi:MAG: nicotinamide phosphoribosyltransferase [Patescibacteria group bacterium]|jgi:nicotinamide phosphoribosyltransferase